MLAKPLQLLSKRPLLFFALSCLLSMIGNGLTYIIMIWTLIELGGSVASTAILMTCFWLPNVVIAPFFGILTDRYSRKTLLLVGTGLRALCLFIFAWVSHNQLTALSIYVLAAAVGIMLALYIPAAMTFVRELVEPKDLLYSNAIVDISYEIGSMVGMGFAGFILAATSSSLCFVINGFCYVLVLGLLLKIDYRKGSHEIKESLLSQFIDGGRYVANDIPLMLVYFAQGILFLCMMTTPVLLAPYAKTVLHANALQFGWLETMLSIGIIAGGFIGPWAASKSTLTGVVIAEIILGILAFYLLGHTEHLSWAIFCQFLIGFSFSCWAILTTMLQEMTVFEFQGRTQALFNSVSGIMIILFYYLLAHWQGDEMTELYVGESILLAIALGLFIWSRYLTKKNHSSWDNEVVN